MTENSDRLPLAVAICLRGIEEEVNWAEITEREHSYQHQRLWSLFQTLADTVSNLYKESQDESPSWTGFQTAASALTHFYKESIELKKRSHELGRRVGYQHAALEMREWMKSRKDSRHQLHHASPPSSTPTSPTRRHHHAGPAASGGVVGGAQQMTTADSLSLPDQHAHTHDPQLLHRTTDKISAFHISSQCGDSVEDVDEGQQQQSRSTSQQASGSRKRTLPPSNNFLFDFDSKRSRFL